MQLPNLFFRNSLSLRPARASDREFIESLYRSTRDDLHLVDASRGFIETLNDQRHLAKTASYSDCFSDAIYFIVEEQGDRIGQVSIDFSHNEIRIIDLSLIPEARGKGYGVKIIKVLKQASNAVCVPIVLNVYKSNSAAKHLYETEGFKVTHSSQMIDSMAWYSGYL
jgi:ribosomal protein S18 acetylase RimI-like enzyme